MKNQEILDFLVNLSIPDFFIHEGPVYVFLTHFKKNLKKILTYMFFFHILKNSRQTSPAS